MVGAVRGWARQGGGMQSRAGRGGAKVGVMAGRGKVGVKSGQSKGVHGAARQGREAQSGTETDGLG